MFAVIGDIFITAIFKRRTGWAIFCIARNIIRSITNWTSMDLTMETLPGGTTCSAPTARRRTSRRNAVFRMVTKNDWPDAVLPRQLLILRRGWLSMEATRKFGRKRLSPRWAVTGLIALCCLPVLAGLAGVVIGPSLVHPANLYPMRFEAANEMLRRTGAVRGFAVRASDGAELRGWKIRARGSRGDLGDPAHGVSIIALEYLAKRIFSCGTDTAS